MCCKHTTIEDIRSTFNKTKLYLYLMFVGGSQSHRIKTTSRRSRTLNAVAVILILVHECKASIYMAFSVKAPSDGLELERTKHLAVLMV